MLIVTDNEPEPKRKTLTERAGEPHSTIPSLGVARPPVKGTSLVAASVSSSSVHHILFEYTLPGALLAWFAHMSADTYLPDQDRYAIYTMPKKG